MADSNNLMGPTAAVAVTAAILSPGVRGLLRKGAVQGLAGVLIASDAVSSFARGVGRGLQAGDVPSRTDASARQGAQEAARAEHEAATATETPAGAPRKTAAKPRSAPKPRKTPAAQRPTVVTEGEA